MRFLTKLVLAPLLAGVAIAMAQPSERFEDAAGCVRLSASRLPSDLNCGKYRPPPIVIRNEAEVTLLIEAPVLKSRQCEATVNIEYQQWSTVASVEGTIENDDCAASSGSYQIAISIRNASGDDEGLEFPHTWQRDDDQPVTFSADYLIGENVDLVRARVLQVECLCTTEPGAPEGEEGNEERD